MVEQESAAERMRVFVMVLLSTCFTLLVLAPVFYVAYKNMPPAIASIDLQKIVEEDQTKLMSAIGTTTGSSAEDRRASGERLSADFAQRLSKNVEQLSAECGCVMINKAALLSGNTIDYTDLLRERMSK